MPLTVVEQERFDSLDTEFGGSLPDDEQDRLADLEAEFGHLDDPSIDPFRNAPSPDNTHLLSAEEASRQADRDFDMSIETNLPIVDIQAFGLGGRPTLRKDAANSLATRFTKQLYNNTISATVRNLTDPDSSAAEDRAYGLLLEWEKKNDVKLPDALFEDQLHDWAQQLYDEPELREEPSLRKEKKWPVPEHVKSIFDPIPVEEKREGVEGFADTAVDAVAGIIGFGAQLKAFNLAFPGTPPAVAWESVSIANGGKPGSASAMYGSMRMIGKFFPAAKPVRAKLGGGIGTGVIFGGTTALAGGSTEEIIVNSGLPVLLSAMSIKSSDWKGLQQKSQLELIRSVKTIIPELQLVTSKDIGAAITRALVAKEVEGIQRLGKSPAKPTTAKPIAAKPIESGIDAEIAAIRRLGKKKTAKQIIEAKPLKPVDATGKTVISKHAKRLEERAVLEGVVGKDALGQLATHQVAEKSKQAAKANAIPPDKALKMVLGEVPIPSDTLHSMVYVAVKNRAMANNDVTTLRALKGKNVFTEATTRHAQELGALANEMQYSPDRMIEDVEQARGVIPDKKLLKGVAKAEKSLRKTQDKLFNKETDIAIKTANKTVKVDIKAKSYGKKNRLVTAAMKDAAWKRLRAQKLFTGVDPSGIADVIEIAAYHMEAIGRNVPAWKKAMEDQFGKKIKPHLDKIWAKTNEKLTTGAMTGAVEKLQGAFAKDGNILLQANLIRDLQDSLIRGGMKTRKPLLSEMHRILNAIDPSITERQTMDAMSSYGQFRLLKKDEIGRIRRDVNQQYQQLAKLQDMAEGIAPKSTGHERQLPSDEGRRLVQKVNEAKKKGGFESSSPEKELKTALSGIKTRLTNRISDLKQQIETGKKTVKGDKARPSDAETVKLQAEKDVLQKQFDDMFGAKQVSPEQRIAMAEKAVQRSITEIERKIKTGDIAPTKRVSKTPKTPELEALRARRDALKEDLNLMRDMARVKKSPEEIALQSIKTRLANEDAKYAEMIAEGNFEEPARIEVRRDAEAARLLIERDTNRRVVQVARQLLEQKGGIADAEILKINTLSKEIKRTKLDLEADPKNRQRMIDYGNAMLDFEDYSTILVPRPNSWRNVALDVAGAPRTLMTTIDLSFPFRQGWGSMATPEFWQGFQKQFGYAWSEDNFRTLMAEIKGSPRFALAKKSGLGLTDLGVKLELREEGAQSTLPERIPIIGGTIRGSERAYTGMANYIRWNRFNNMVDAAILQGRSIKGAEGLKLTRDIANVINVTTGRGNLGPPRRDRKGNVIRTDPLGVASPEFNQFLFSARKLSADIMTLPQAVGVGKYGLLDPFARRMAQKQLLGSLAMTTSILGLAKMAGLDVETNPSSGNFGKVVAGNHHIDITGGKASMLTFVWRMGTGKIKDSERGETTDLTPWTRGKVVERYVRGKLSPNASLFADAVIFHANYKGDPVETPSEIGKAIASRLYPMSIGDTIQILEDDAEGDIVAKALLDISLIGLATFGTSVSTYEDSKSGPVRFDK